MAQLNIYDSEGNEFKGSGGSRQQSDRIRNFFYAGVRLAIDVSRPAEIVVFFRARRGGDRAEQYYAVYQPDSRHRPLQNLKSDLKRKVESEYGLSIVESGTDTAVFSALTESTQPPGSESDRNAIGSLLNQGHRIQVGVGGPEAAVTLLKSVASDQNAQRLAIADQANHDALSEYDFVVEPGNYRGVEPLGDTEQLMQRHRQQNQRQVLDQRVGNIKEEVNALRSGTQLSDDQIRDRLKQELPVFSGGGGGSLGGGDTSGSTLGGSSGGLGGSSESKQPVPIPSAKMLAVGVAVMIVIAAVGGLFWFGPYDTPLSKYFSGGENGEEGPPGGEWATISDVTVNGTKVTVTGVVNVSDPANATVTVTLDPKEGEPTTKTLKKKHFDGEEFEVTFSGVSSDEFTITLEKEGKESVTFEYPADQKNQKEEEKPTPTPTIPGVTADLGYDNKTHNLTITVDTEKQANVTLFRNGKRFEPKKLATWKNRNGSGKRNVTIKNIPYGTYELRVSTDSGTVTKRLTVDPWVEIKSTDIDETVEVRFSANKSVNVTITPETNNLNPSKKTPVKSRPDVYTKTFRNVSNSGTIHLEVNGRELDSETYNLGPRLGLLAELRGPADGEGRSEFTDQTPTPHASATLAARSRPVGTLGQGT